MKPISDLRYHYDGQDVYVVGGGPSLSYIPAEFFMNKPIVSVNSVCRLRPVDWIVCKDQWLIKELVAEGHENIIVSEYNFGNHAQPKLTGGDYVFKHPDLYPIEYSLTINDLRQVDIDNDEIAVGPCNLNSAMHIAAYMGAANIILIGVDGGTIDGQFYADGYPVHNDQASRDKAQVWRSATDIFRDWLVETYDIGVYSLNPWLNFALEGHVYQTV